MVSKSITEQFRKPIKRFSIYGNYISGDKFIRQSDYIFTLELPPNELKKLNSRLAIGVGIIPKLQPQLNCSS